jgi:tetratricopeptide (TPR) repeat protein
VEPRQHHLRTPFDAYLRYYLGSAALAEGDADAARAHFEASLRELDADDDDLPHAVMLGSLGLLAARRGEHTEARARFAESLPVLREGRDQWDLALLLLNAGLEEAQGESPAAGRALLPATDPLLHVIVPYDLSTQLAAARARDDPAAFDRGLSEGQAWNIDRAVAAGVANPAGPDADLE